MAEYDLSVANLQRGIALDDEIADEATRSKSTESDADKAARRKAIEEARVKQFDEAADEMESALAEVFASSLAELIGSLKSGWTPDPENAERQAAKLLDKAHDPAVETKLVMEAVVVPMLMGFAAGVEQQREETKSFKKRYQMYRQLAKKPIVKRPRKRKMLDKPKTSAEKLMRELGLDVDLDGIIEEFGVSMRMPEWMVEKAIETLGDTLQRDFWQKISETTRTNVETTLLNAIQEGKSIRDISKELTERHGEEYTRARANTVARTEVGNMLESGHASGIDELAEETGLDVKKVWQSVLGSTTRDSHAALHDVEADDDGMFELGGVLVPWPAHPDLDVAERANCQCFLISSLL